MKRFFITGCQRTGTTLIRLILETHPNIFCFDEHTAYKALHDDDYSKAEGAEFLGFKIPRWAEQLNDPWLYDAHHGIWSPQLYSGEPVLFMVRDVRDVVSSMMALKSSSKNWWQTWGLPTLRMKLKASIFREYYDSELAVVGNIDDNPEAAAALYWKFKTAPCLDYLSLGFPVMVIIYEDFVAHPEEYLRRIITHIGTTWDDCLLSHHTLTHSEISSSGTAIGDTDPKRAIDDSSIHRWISSLTDKALNQLMTISGDLNSSLRRDFGFYSRSFSENSVPNNDCTIHKEDYADLIGLVGPILDWLVEQEEELLLAKETMERAETDSSTVGDFRPWSLSDGKTIEFSGFHSDEGGRRWMTRLGYIRIDTNISGAELRFTLRNGQASQYSTLPFSVFVRVIAGDPTDDDHTILFEKVTFDSSDETRELILLLPKNDVGVVVRLESEEFFVPSLSGDSDDARELAVIMENIQLSF